jgi:hypothetical protein
MDDAAVTRLKNRAADFRQMAERTEEAERERKLLMLAQALEGNATRLEDALRHSDR